MTLPQRVHDEFVLCGVGPRAKRVALFNIKVRLPFAGSVRYPCSAKRKRKQKVAGIRSHNQALGIRDVPLYFF